MENRFQLGICGLLWLIYGVSLFTTQCSGMEVLGHGIINTTYGPVQGKSVTLLTNTAQLTKHELVQFLGIPYANASRFEAPEPPTTWHNETLQATAYGKSCPQAMNKPPYNLRPDSISEYCLNLNVFVPNTTAFRNQSASIPVMFWLHGGAFIMGTSAAHDASIMATEGGVVVVTVNYRLGALGFLSTGDEELKGNFAMLDVIEALKWVRDNIANFSGDPTNITLSGWSAGARMVSMIMLSPQASGLYHRAILMSGVAGSIFSYLTQKEAKERAEYYGALLRCPYPSSDFINCLKRKSIEEIVDAQARTLPCSFLTQWAPVIDGHLIPDIPNKIIRDGNYNATDVIMGVESSDGSAFLNDIPGINEGVDVKNGFNVSAFNSTVHTKTWLRHQDRRVPNMTVFQYTDWSNPNDGNKTRDAYLNMITDAVYRAPAIEAADAFTKRGMKVYFYQTEYREANDVYGKPYPYWMGVPHGDVLRYLFPSLNITVVSRRTEMFMDPWTNFIKTGNPNIPGQDVWPLYTLTEGNYLAIRSFALPQTKLRVEKMKFWNAFLPTNGVREEEPRPQPPPEKDMDGVTIALIVISCLFGVLLIILIVLIVLLLRGGTGGSGGTPSSRDTRQPAAPPAQTYSVQSKKPILYSSEKYPPKYDNYPRYAKDEKDYPSYPMHDSKSYPNDDKSYPRYPDAPENYPPYSSYDNDGSYYQEDQKADLESSDKFMDSDML